MSKVVFVNDTSMIFKIDRQKENLYDVNEAVSQALNWCTCNILLFNTNKYV